MARHQYHRQQRAATATARKAALKHGSSGGMARLSNMAA